jgi:hypothetical protein
MSDEGLATKSIKVRADTYEAIARLQALITLQTGKRVYLMDVVHSLIERELQKVSREFKEQGAD